MMCCWTRGLMSYGLFSCVELNFGRLSAVENLMCLQDCGFGEMFVTISSMSAFVRPLPSVSFHVHLQVVSTKKCFSTYHSINKGMSGTCPWHHLGLVWGIIWAMSGARLGHPLGHVWGMSGTTSGASSGAFLGHVWGIIWGMFGTTSGACLGYHRGMFGT